MPVPIYCDESSVFGDGTPDHPLLSAPNSIARFPNLKMVNAKLNLATVTSPVATYTCPANRRAMLSFANYWNAGTPAWSTLTFTYFSAAESATFTLITVNLAATTTRSNLLLPIIVLNPGDQIQLSITGTGSASGVNTWLNFLEFDATSNVRSVFLFGTVTGTGANVLYTNLTANGALLLTYAGIPPYGADATLFLFGNSSGGTRTITAYIIPSGGVAETLTQLGPTISAASAGYNGIESQNCTATLSPGDSIAFTVDATTGTQWAWTTVVEF
jgi:hypothetical protein